jgi:hypothetical protein
MGRRRTDGLRGVTKVKGRWKAQIRMHGRQVKFGDFAIKEQAAAAYDIQPRLINGNAVCNYDSPEDADEAIREASHINGLINAGFMDLIMEGFGPAKHEEALQRLAALVPIWRKNVAADVLKKAEKTAARERATQL